MPETASTNLGDPPETEVSTTTPGTRGQLHAWLPQADGTWQAFESEGFDGLLGGSELGRCRYPRLGFLVPDEPAESGGVVEIRTR